MNIFRGMMTRLQRKPLATAMGLSLFVHFAIFWDGEFELPDFSPDSPDEVLSKKKADSIPRVKLTIKPPARPKPQLGAAIVTLIEEAPPAAEKVAPAKPKQPKKNVATKKPKAEKPEEPINGDNLANQGLKPPENPFGDKPEDMPNSDKAIPLGDNLPPPPEDIAKTPAPPIDEPPPAFPVEIHARYKISFMGFSGNLKQTWRMEGENYSIDNVASKFGFNVAMTSEGRVSNSGISPEKYRMYVNSKLRSFADIDRSTNIIRYGKPNVVKYAPIENEIQDFASLPFQVAVSFTGTESRKMQVTSGNSIYNIELKLVSEEMIKLPAGVIKTLHLQGQRINVSTGIAQQGYDVWLAPDYRNFPVKFRGPDSKGEVMEYSVKTLSFEGQTVLGKNLKPELETPDMDTLPPELLENPKLKQEHQPALNIGEDAP